MEQKKIPFFLVFLLTIIVALPLFSQQKDSVSVKQTQRVEASQHSPKKAAIMSAIIPGLGQIYNKKYWKPPLLYAAFGGLGYLIVFNNDRYKLYKQAYIYSTDADPNTINQFSSKYSDANLLTLKNAYQRSRDLAIIGTAVVYVLNIVDAAVDAHMFTFDVSDKLTLHIEPTFQVLSNNITSPTLSIRASF